MGIEVPKEHRFKCLYCHKKAAYHIKIDGLEGQYCQACGSETPHERRAH